MKRIEFGELRIEEIARRNLIEVCNDQWASSGKKVKEFETRWGHLFGYAKNKAVSSGTDAVLNLVMSLYEYGAKRGDEVIVPALSFIATSNAVLMAGFEPVFVDIETNTLNIDPSKIEVAITNKTRAILVVHTMGHVCDMPKILEIANKHNIKVLEDCCEAHGAKYDGIFVGTESEGAAFSFYVAHLICCGEGGMVSTNNNLVAKSVGSTRSHGREEGSLYFDHVRIGFNSKMNDMEASLGLEGIENFGWTFSVRKDNWYELVKFTEQFKDKAWFSYEREGTVACPHGFSIVLKPGSKLDIGKLASVFDNYNIHWKRNFGCIPTQHKAYAFMGYKYGVFPHAEYVGNNGIHIGTHQYLTVEDIGRIKNALQEYFTS